MRNDREVGSSIKELRERQVRETSELIDKAISMGDPRIDATHPCVVIERGSLNSGIFLIRSAPDLEQAEDLARAITEKEPKKLKKVNVFDRIKRRVMVIPVSRSTA